MRNTYSLLKEQITAVIETLGVVDMQHCWSPCCVLGLLLFISACIHIALIFLVHIFFSQILPYFSVWLYTAVLYRSHKNRLTVQMSLPYLKPDADVCVCNCCRGIDLQLFGLPPHWCKILMTVIRGVHRSHGILSFGRTRVAARAGSALHVLGR